MRLPVFIAMRYLFSRKSTNAINIISFISMLAMMLGAMALIIILSVFNGFEGLVISLYNVFYADMHIKPVSGKVLMADDALLKKISSTDGIESYSLSLEENAYFSYNKKQFIGVVKGVDKNYTQVSPVNEFMLYGNFQLMNDSLPCAVLGAGIDAALNAYRDENPYMLHVYMPKRGKKTVINPEDLFASGFLQPSGVFAVQADFDDKYVITPLAFAQQLLRYYNNEVSSIDIKKTAQADGDDLKKRLQKKLGPDFKVETRYEQNKILYRVMNIERWAVVAILFFVLLIISFNMLGSISMLVLEKQKDIGIMHAMGFRPAQIRNIFLAEGVLMGLLGAVCGVFLGVLVCIVQQQTGIIKLQGETFVTDSYPVLLKGSDFVLTFSIIVFISLVASALPAIRAARVRSTVHGE